MSDEATESVPGLKPIQYTARHYALYLDRMLEVSEKLNRGEQSRERAVLTAVPGADCVVLWSSVDPQRDWTPHRLELCLWALTVATQLQPPLLGDVVEDLRPAKKPRTR